MQTFVALQNIKHDFSTIRTVQERFLFSRRGR